MDNTVLALWARWQWQKSPALRDQLLTAYWPRVRQIARKMSQRLPAYLDVDDLAGAGSVGLVKAVDRWARPEELGLPDYVRSWEAWAAILIRGAILDDIRKQDWAPRSLRRQARALFAATEEIETSAGRLPREGEIAIVLGCEVAKVRQLRTDVFRSQFTAFKAEGGTGYHPEDDVAAPDERSTETHLAVALHDLPPAMLLMVWLVTHEKVTVLGAATVLGICPGGVPTEREERRAAAFHEEACRTLTEAAAQALV